MGKSAKPATSTINQTQATDQTTTSTRDAWAPAQGALTAMVNNAAGAYSATPKTPTYTGLNAQQQTAQGMLTGLAPSTAQGAGSVLANAQKTSDGYYLDPKNNSFIDPNSINPNIDALIHSSIQPLRDQLDSDVLSIGDAAKLAGAYGGDRQDLLKATALGKFDQNAMSTSANIRYQGFNDAQNRAMQAYQAERQNQMNASNLFSDANTLAMNPAKIISALGDQSSQATTQANQAAADAPWAGLDRLSQILSGVQGYGSTTGTTNGTVTTNGTTTATPAQGATGGVAGGLSGALGGASAGAAFGPWGAGIGAVVGGLGGLFG